MLLSPPPENALRPEGVPLKALKALVTGAATAFVAGGVVVGVVPQAGFPKAEPEAPNGVVDPNAVAGEACPNADTGVVVDAPNADFGVVVGVVPKAVVAGFAGL